MEKNKTYEVAGRTFTMPALVLGQVQMLLALLRDTALPADLAPMAVMATLGDKLAELLAVVLVPAGGDFADPVYRAQLPDLTAWLCDHLPAQTAAQMVADFFAVNAGFFDLIKAAVNDKMPTIPAPTSKS